MYLHGQYRKNRQIFILLLMMQVKKKNKIKNKNKNKNKKLYGNKQKKNKIK